MANSTTHLDAIVNGQGSQDVKANSLWDAGSTAMLYGRRASSTSGLSWGYYGGNVTLSTGTMSQIANGAIALTASTTNYLVVLKSTGVLTSSTATTNWTDVDNYWKIYSIVTGTSTITSYTDYRELGKMTGGIPTPVDAFTLTIQTVTGATKTLAVSDLGAWIRFTGTDPILTVPLNATVSIANGKYFMGVQGGSTQVTFTPEGGVTINKPSGYKGKTRAQGSSWALTKIDTNEWDLTGDLEAT